MEVSNSQIDIRKRLESMFIDVVSLVFGSMILSLPGLLYTAIERNGTRLQDTQFFIYSSLFIWSLYFNKDIYFGRSIGKRISNLQVIDIKSNLPASPVKCFVRNLPILIWPIEGLVVLINPSRRIGDLIAGTRLVVFQPMDQEEKPAFSRLIAFLTVTWIAILFLFILGKYLVVQYFIR